MKYFNRLAVFVYLLLWLIWSVEKIGKPPSGGPITWWAALTFVFVIATSAWFGWLARKEFDEEQKQ